MSEIILNGITYIKKTDNFETNGITCLQKTKNCENNNIKIVILHGEIVMVGRFIRNGSDCKLLDSYTIRRSGATDGLGELALKGKLEYTILDKNNGEVAFDYLSVIATINCKEKVWEQIL